MGIITLHAGKRSSIEIVMHRVIAGLDRFDPREVDHKDGNGLNNTRNNLRIYSRQQNAQNQIYANP